MLLLANFLVFQYARQVSYWECRLSNYFKTESQQCDCENLLKQVKSHDAPAPAAHSHFHLDESFYPSRTIAAEGIYNKETLSWLPAKDIFIGKILPARLDRPPQNRERILFFTCLRLN